MNRNHLLIGAALVGTIVGGIFLSQRLRKRSLPEGEMVQTTPTADQVGNSIGVIPGRPQVKIITSQGEAVVELHPEVDNTAVAGILAKLSQGECANQTVLACGLADKSYVQVVSGQLTPDAKISSIFILGK